MSVSIKIQRLILPLQLIFIVSICMLPLAGFANDTHKKESILKNTDDVTRVKEFASQVASQPEPQLIAALRVEENAAKALQEALQTGNPLLIDAAQKAYHVSEAAAQAAMAAFSGVKPADITGLRNNDMDWAQIVQWIGIHPDVIGSPQTNGNVSRYQSEMMPATSRDLKSGRSMMDGFHSGSNSGYPSMGSGHRSRNYGDWDHMNGGPSSEMGDGHGGNSRGGMEDGHGGSFSGGMEGGYGGSSGGGIEDSHGDNSRGGMGGGHGDSSGGGMGGGSWR